MAASGAGRAVAAAFLGGLVAVAGGGLVGTAIHAGSPASVLEPPARSRPAASGAPSDRASPAVPRTGTPAPLPFPGTVIAPLPSSPGEAAPTSLVQVSFLAGEEDATAEMVVPLVESRPATEPRGLVAGDRAPDADALENTGIGVPQLDGGSGARRGPISTWIRDSFEEMRATRGGVVPFPQRQAAAGGGRLIDRIRAGERILGRDRGGEKGAREQALARGWPTPATLLQHLEQLTTSERATSSVWAKDTSAVVRRVIATGGPDDPAAEAALLDLHAAVAAGIKLADEAAAKAEVADAATLRRAALAAQRREVVWLAATRARGGETEGAPAERVPDLLERLERYESAPTPADATAIVAILAEFAGGERTAALADAVRDQYAAANVRVAVHQKFVERVLPPTQVTSAPVDDTVLGRQVRGTSRVAQSTAVRFTPDADGISVILEVKGQVASRTVTETGPVALVSRGNSSFTVRKPLTVDGEGLSLGKSRGSASSRSQLADIQTSFDGVPIMRSLVRNIARNQHDDHLPEANREVIDKIVSRACREVDQQVEPRLVEAAERVRTQAWGPLVRLGLDPTPVNLETSGGIAMARLRLAADDQLAAFTPRPRAPAGSMLSVQIHESAINNTLERLGLAGRRLPLEDLVHLLCDRAGVEPDAPDDLPEDVVVGFAASQPLRVQYRDGLVHVRVALDSLESGRRAWHDIVASVAYRPKASDPQLFLEREGPVHIGGTGRQGRAEIALRAVFGKIFPKERPLPLLPQSFVEDPKLADLKVLQATAADGWLAISLGETPPSTTSTGKVATAPQTGSRRGQRR